VTGFAIVLEYNLETFSAKLSVQAGQHRKKYCTIRAMEHMHNAGERTLSNYGTVV
jgi:hypothetical protein